MGPEGLLPCSQEPASSEALCNMSWQADNHGVPLCKDRAEDSVLISRELEI
jgi:hypothetical protein